MKDAARANQAKQAAATAAAAPAEVSTESAPETQGE
jgi:hypothetical protein